MGDKFHISHDASMLDVGRQANVRSGLAILVVSFLLFAATLTVGAPVGALPASGNGRVSIKEHKFFNPPSVSTQPTSTYFTAIDAFGHPTMSSSNATCTRAISNAQGGIFAHLRTAHSINSLDELPCGTHSGNSARGVEVQVDGVLLVPEGASSLRIRAHNKSFNGSTRAVWFALWTAEGPNPAGLVERVFKKVGASPASITTDIPLSTVCASPGAFAFRLYIFEDSPSFGVNLRWSIDGGFFVDIPASAYSTVGGLNLQDTNPANGTADYLEVDTDADGLGDWTEMQSVMSGASLDTDGDLTPDCLDTDSDNDGTPDGADPNPKNVVADDDSLVLPSGGAAALNVLDNDDFVAGAGVRIVVTGGDAPGTIDLDNEGELTYDAVGSLVGDYTIDYDICNDNVSPSVCASATVDISIGPGPVDAAMSAIEASEPSITADGISASTLTIRMLDTAGNFVGTNGGDV